MVWTEQVVTPFTATMGDAFVGSTRLKLANEGAVRKNIAQLVAKLGAAALPVAGGERSRDFSGRS